MFCYLLRQNVFRVVKFMPNLVLRRQHCDLFWNLQKKCCVFLLLPQVPLQTSDDGPTKLWRIDGRLFFCSTICQRLMFMVSAAPSLQLDGDMPRGGHKLSCLSVEAWVHLETVGALVRRKPQAASWARSSRAHPKPSKVWGAQTRKACPGNVAILRPCRMWKHDVGLLQPSPPPSQKACEESSILAAVRKVCKVDWWASALAPPSANFATYCPDPFSCAGHILSGCHKTHRSSTYISWPCPPLSVGCTLRWPRQRTCLWPLQPPLSVSCRHWPRQCQNYVCSPLSMSHRRWPRQRNYQNKHQPFQHRRLPLSVNHLRWPRPRTSLERLHPSEPYVTDFWASLEAPFLQHHPQNLQQHLSDSFS